MTNYVSGFESGAGARLLTERGVALKAIEGGSSLPSADSAPAVLDELCFWTLEIDRIMERCKVEPNPNHVRHFLSLIEQAHDELRRAESDSSNQQAHVRRAKVLTFAMARLARSLGTKSD